MNRIDFMNELRALLLDILPEEREEAMQYYNDYFDDAGVENEASIIKELGSPQKVADTIKAGLGTTDESSSEYRETGYADTRFEDCEMPARREGYRSTENVHDKKKEPWTSQPLKVLLVILIVLVGAPVVLPVFGGVLVAIIAVLIAVVAVVAAVLVSGIAVGIGGIVLIGTGFTQIFHSVPIACGLIGGGLLMAALGAAGTALMWWICVKIIPPVFRWIVELCRKPFQKGRRSAE